MTKAIRSYPQSEQAKVVARRLKSKTGGLGYLSAKDAVEKGKAKVEAEAETPVDPDAVAKALARCRNKASSLPSKPINSPF